MPEMHPSVWNDLKEICGEAFFRVWFGSTECEQIDSNWSCNDEIDSGVDTLDTMRAIFGDNVVRDAINESRYDEEAESASSPLSDDCEAAEPNDGPDLNIDFDWDDFRVESQETE